VSEELEKVVDDLKRKYPELTIPLGLAFQAAAYMKDNANWCRLGKVVDNAITLGTHIDDVIEKVSSEETMVLLEAKDKLIKEVCETLVKKCECKIAREI
jgi:hypothetical protein